MCDATVPFRNRSTVQKSYVFTFYSTLVILGLSILILEYMIKKLFFQGLKPSGVVAAPSRLHPVIPVQLFLTSLLITRHRPQLSCQEL